MRIDSLDQLYDQYRRHLAVVEQLRDQVREDPALGKALLTAALQDINDGPDWKALAQRLSDAAGALLRLIEPESEHLPAFDALLAALAEYERAKKALL